MSNSQTTSQSVMSFVWRL